MEEILKEVQVLLQALVTPMGTLTQDIAFGELGDPLEGELILYLKILRCINQLIMDILIAETTYL